METKAAMNILRMKSDVMMSSNGENFSLDGADGMVNKQLANEVNF